MRTALASLAITAALVLAFLAGRWSTTIHVPAPDVASAPAAPPVLEWAAKIQEAALQEQHLVSPEEMVGPCVVTNVIDGDTVDVRCANTGSRIRLLRIDTPERGQPAYREATEALRQLIGGREVRLVFEIPMKPEKGRYGRTLAYLYDTDGRNLNVEMVREGWSTFWTKYGRGRFEMTFEEAQFDAMIHRRGLWASR